MPAIILTPGQLQPEALGPRVLKLGGSLLTLSDWPSRLRSWLAANPSVCNLFVVGGGELVEAVRTLDSIHRLDETFVHWLCIDLLDATAQIAERLLPEFGSVTSSLELSQFLQAPGTAAHSRSAIVRVGAFYDRQTAAPSMPQDWSATSDSLAALLAKLCGAHELVLFKSVPALAPMSTASQLVQANIVDRAFDRVAADLPRIRVVNLRSA